MEGKDTLEGIMFEHRCKGVIRNGGGGVLGHQSDRLCGRRREELERDSGRGPQATVLTIGDSFSGKRC